MNFDKIEFVDVNRHSIQNYLQLIVDERHIDMEEHFKQFTLLDYMVQMVKDAFKLQRHIVFDGVTEEEYNKWKLEQDALEKSKTGAPKITFADEPFEFDEQLIDFEEAFEEDFNKENSNGNANDGDNNSNDKSIDTNGNKLGTSINVLPTVIEENETDSYIPSTSKSNQHQHQQEQNRQMKHLGIHIDHRLVRHQYQVVMVYLLVIPNIHHKHKDQHLVYHLNLIHNNNSNNNSHHHHYCHRTKTINTTNRIYNPHLQGVNYHLQDQKISNFTSTIKFFKLFTIIIITTITLSSNRT